MRENFEGGRKDKMHSLSLNVPMDFNAGTSRSSWPGRISGGVSDLEVGSRKLVLNCRDNNPRFCRIVACSSERNSSGGGGQSSSSSSSSSSFLSRSQTYALLKQQMEVAARSEVRF